VIRDERLSVLGKVFLLGSYVIGGGKESSNLEDNADEGGKLRYCAANMPLRFCSCICGRFPCRRRHALCFNPFLFDDACVE